MAAPKWPFRGVTEVTASRPLASALAVLALVLLAPGARAEAVFTVDGVAVDQTAETAAAARETALAAGQARAFRQLLQRLTVSVDWPRLPQLSGAEVAEQVQAIEIENEKTSAVRYLAELTVSFKPESVRRLLQANDIPMAETPGQPVLVLPVYRTPDALLLWEEANPWLAVWLARGGDRQALRPVVVPVGDLQDLVAVSAQQAVAGDAVALAAVAERYGASSAIVLLADVKAGPGGAPPQVTVWALRHDESLGVAETLAQLPPVPLTGEADPQALLAPLAEQILQGVQDHWKEPRLLQFDQQSEMQVRVPLDGLDDWISVRRHLQAVPAVRDSKLVQIARDEARVALRYVGDPQRLRLLLAQGDLELEQSLGDWVLRLRPRAIRGATTGATSGEPGGAPADTGVGSASPSAPLMPRLVQ
jgi:hypothetical protein